MAASTSSRVCSSSMFLMKWNGIMESFLIDEVEKLPYLWNPRHPHFTKRLKKIGFQQIAMRMSERWPALEAFLTPAPSESELPQRIRVFTSTPVSTSTPPVTTSTPPVTTSTPRVSTSTPRAKKRKVESSQEAFYESMQKCLGAVGKKTVNETFAAFIASELDNLPWPKQQVAVRRKLCATLFECLE
ncbi:hypothetical protein TNCV_1514601 [Trichonephila clavipes]|nr:hypothetical protein TNCV_1514601 [Trichonephila clavipes]